MYYGGTRRTFYKRGEEETAVLYYGAGTEKVTKQGVKVGIDLYFKNSSGGYSKFGYDVYRAGSEVTFYKRGNLYGGVIYKDGGTEDVMIQGEMVQSALFTGGTKRANLNLATFEATTADLAYSTT